jgi:UDP-N-acetylglucosamine 2-epimerase (non-hydrolysing)
VKILIVFGTRPEAIKMSPIIHELKKSHEVSVCVTAQHREMLDQVLNIFDITPKYDLDVMRPNQDLFDLTSRVLNGLKTVLIEDSPNLVIVHGDTTTSMASSLAAFYMNIPVAHVEAGLRTYKLNSPFPEEINRQLVSRIAHINFAPTEKARQNLLSEGIENKKISVTGNSVIDAMLSVLDQARRTPFPNALVKDLPFIEDAILAKLVLITGHRRENFGKGFENICQAIRVLAKKHPKVNFVYPVHLNPNVMIPASNLLNNLENIYLIKPQEYISFVKLMDLSYLILTDSGGVQEEAPSIGKPVLVMRENTERPEAVEAGTVKLVGSTRDKIVKEVEILLTQPDIYMKMSKAYNPYGDGKTSSRIKDKLEEIFQ